MRKLSIIILVLIIPLIFIVRGTSSISASNLNITHGDTITGLELTNILLKNLSNDKKIWITIGLDNGTYCLFNGNSRDPYDELFKGKNCYIDPNTVWDVNVIKTKNEITTVNFTMHVDRKIIYLS
jgi:hypothetical protein